MKNIFYLNNRLEDWQPGMTIRDLLEKKIFTFPMLVVKINGTLIKKSEYAVAKIPENADVQIIHLMSGG